MKKLLLVNVLLLSFIISKAQIIQNPSLEASAPPLGSGVIPDYWSELGVTAGLMDSGGAYGLTVPILHLFPSADATDLFWYFFSNTGGQFGGISQILQNLEPNSQYCFSFEAGVNRPWTPSSAIDLELYFNGILSDSETFYYPSETSSRRVELCFTTGAGITTGTISMRTNNLQGATTFILIQAGSGEFSCSNPLDLNITFDNNPAKTSWEITDANGNVVASSGGTYNGQSGSSTLNVTPACLPDGCYDLTFYSALNKGMCPFNATASSAGTFITPGTLITAGNVVATLGTVVAPSLCGNYQLYDADGNLLVSGGGDFGASETNNFCLVNGTAQRTSPNAGFTFDNEMATNAALVIYPVPASEFMTIQYHDDEDTQINIIDSNGKILQQHLRDKDANPIFTINIADIPVGIYFVQSITNDIVTIEKFVKQ